MSSNKSPTSLRDRESRIQRKFKKRRRKPRAKERGSYGFKYVAF